MLKQVAVAGYTFEQSNPLPAAAVTFTITVEDVPAQRVTATSKPVLVKELSLNCTCSGSLEKAGQITYAGTGSGVLVATTSRVTCEGREVIARGDNVTVECTGTSTDTKTGTTTPGVGASVKVTVIDAGQTIVLASDA